MCIRDRPYTGDNYYDEDMVETDKETGKPVDPDELGGLPTDVYKGQHQSCRNL